MRRPTHYALRHARRQYLDHPCQDRHMGSADRKATLMKVKSSMTVRRAKFPCSDSDCMASFVEIADKILDKFESGEIALEDPIQIDTILNKIVDINGRIRKLKQI